MGTPPTALEAQGRVPHGDRPEARHHDPTEDAVSPAVRGRPGHHGPVDRFGRVVAHHHVLADGGIRGGPGGDSLEAGVVREAEGHDVRGRPLDRDDLPDDLVARQGRRRGHRVAEEERQGDEDRGTGERHGDDDAPTCGRGRGGRQATARPRKRRSPGRSLEVVDVDPVRARWGLGRWSSCTGGSRPSGVPSRTRSVAVPPDIQRSPWRPNGSGRQPSAVTSTRPMPARRHRRVHGLRTWSPQPQATSLRSTSALIRSSVVCIPLRLTLPRDHPHSAQ